MPTLARSLGLVVCLVVVGAGSSCKKRPVIGGRCEGADWVAGIGVCMDATTYLSCRMNGQYEPFACKGKRGCFGTGKGRYAEICDFTGNPVGDPCPHDGARPEQAQCEASGKSTLVCALNLMEGNKPILRTRSCGGADGCAPAPGGTVTCDSTAAAEGDGCDSGSAIAGRLYTCRTDGKAMLGCYGSVHDQKWLIARACKGPKGCVAEKGDRNAGCDGTVSDVGDPCVDSATLTSCSSDGKSRLVCKEKKLALDVECAKGCTTKWTAPGIWNVDCLQ